MKYLIVVNSLSDWDIKSDEIEIVTARDYIKNDKYSSTALFRVLNLCNSYNYQTLGYYVSLIASARGHKPQPSLTCIEDFKNPSMIRLLSNELEELTQKCLSKRITSDNFTLSIYFGKNVAKTYDRLASYLFKQFLTPFLQAKFSVNKEGKWGLTSLRPLSLNQIPESHKEFAMEQTINYLTKKRRFLSNTEKNKARFDLAILYNPDEESSPSNKKAIQKFVKAAERIGLATEIISKADFGRLAEYDALFIRETTQVNHYTYRFARKAIANGLEVIDDPLSILRCCNKVYLHELLDRHNIPIPMTQIIDKDSMLSIAESIDYPCVLKQPDSAFSKGVIKVASRDKFISCSTQLLENSDLILVQEYLPSTFDWRIGILDGKPLFACKYYMVKNHWQIYKTLKTGKRWAGGFECLPIEEAPKQVVKLALKAANLVGTGFYGVDIKEINGRFYVIEVNDNPNVDAGVEDVVLGDQLYEAIVQVLCDRIEKKKERISHDHSKSHAKVYT